MPSKFIFFAFIFMLSASFALAQQTTGEHQKFEFYGGYLNTQVENGRVRLGSAGNILRVRDSHNGFELSAVGNFNRYFGIKGDFSAGFENRGSLNSSLYNFLGGVQIKDNAKDGTRFRPFAHALVGVGTTKTAATSSFLNSSVCHQPNIFCNVYKNVYSGFAAALGGGLDIRVSRRISARAIQFDYNPTHPSSNTQDNFRFGFGVVFH